MHPDSPAHRFDRAGKLDQQSIAGGFDDATAVPGNARIDQLSPARLEAVERSFLIRAHEARITSNICSDNRSELAFAPRSGDGL
jgi:hypothetical protein